jgi:hypothetical protein
MSAAAYADFDRSAFADEQLRCWVALAENDVARFEMVYRPSCLN